MGEGSSMPTDPQHTPTFIQSSPPPQKTQKPRKPKRKDTQVPQPSGPTDIVADEAVHKELGDSLTTQANKIASLKRRVKKLEPKKRSRTHGLKRLRKVGFIARVESFRDEESLGEDASKHGRRINDIDENEDITLVNVQDDADNEMFDVATVTGDEVFAEQKFAAKIWYQVSAASASIKVSAATTTTATILTPRKGIVITELEPEKPLKKKDLIRLDEEIASKLEAKFDKEERLAREKAGSQSCLD
ncbi:hypothetical protein Tco_0887628 [Tanacetum coccineum]